MADVTDRYDSSEFIYLADPRSHTVVRAWFDSGNLAAILGLLDFLKQGRDRAEFSEACARRQLELLTKATQALTEPLKPTSHQPSTPVAKDTRASKGAIEPASSPSISDILSNIKL